MENENVTVTLQISEWNSILGALSTAPFQVINQISSAINNLQVQAGPQVAEAAKKHAVAEEAPAAE
jgi:hypothetical protein